MLLLQESNLESLGCLQLVSYVYLSRSKTDMEGDGRVRGTPGACFYYHYLAWQRCLGFSWAMCTWTIAILLQPLSRGWSPVQGTPGGSGMKSQGRELMCDWRAGGCRRSLPWEHVSAPQMCCVSACILLPTLPKVIPWHLSSVGQVSTPPCLSNSFLRGCHKAVHSPSQNPG